MAFLSTDLTLGEPQVAGALAVFPLFGPAPLLDYRSFPQAARMGAFVKELGEGASVNDLVLANPTDLPLLVYEGEEVLGAQQNRTFDCFALVDVRATVRLPVSCVEAGRWDGTRHSEPFTPSPQTADPALRARKRMRSNEAAAVGLEARPSQGEVWEVVQQCLDAHMVHSPSAAMSDLYDSRRDELAELAQRVRPLEHQVGTVVFVGGRPVALDVVSRAEVFTELLPRLVQGYALEALRSQEAEADPFEAERFLDAAATAPRRPLPVPGSGAGLRLESAELTGSGVEHEGELVAMSVFPRRGEGR